MGIAMVKWLAAVIVCLWSVPALAWTHGTSTNLFPVTCTGVDDSAAINAALDKAVAAYVPGVQAAGGIYIPTGVCVYKTFHTTMQAAVSIYGDGNMHSIIKVDPTNAGDVFSWNFTWEGTSFSGSANTVGSDYTRPGVHVQGISVIGTRLASGNQHAFTFYDPTDFVYFDDVAAYYMKGSCLRWGVTKVSGSAFMRESEFHNLRCQSDGDTNYAVIDITSHGTADGTNNINFYDTNVYSHYGPGVRIRADTGSVGTSDMNFYHLRIEQASANSQNFDSLVIGDATQGGTVNRIDCYSCVFSQTSATTNAIHTLAPDSPTGNTIYGLNFYSSVAANSTGDAINLTAGKIMRLGFWLISTPTGGKKDIIIGPTAGGMNAPIVIDPQGAGSAWDVTIDASMSANVFQPTYAAYP